MILGTSKILPPLFAVPSRPTLYVVDAFAEDITQASTTPSAAKLSKGWRRNSKTGESERRKQGKQKHLYSCAIIYYTVCLSLIHI